MSVTMKSSDALSKRLAAMLPEIKKRVQPMLIKSAEEVARDARTLAEASVRTGTLRDTIEATGPNQTTPAYGSDGGQRTLGDLQAAVTVGSPEARHGHLVEFGTEERQRKDGSSTGTMPAEPFLLPSWRLNKARVERRLDRAINAGIKDAAK